MVERARDDLEHRVYDLLNGWGNASSRRELLSLIAKDERARAALWEAVKLQDDARAAYGYAVANRSMHASLRRLIESLASERK